MAKELPYFKFFPSEWVTGDITLCTMAAQGLFANICAYYWMKNCSMSLANAKQRFSKDEAELKELLNNGIIKTDNDENIIITFLDKQMSDFVDVSEKRAKAGRSGGQAKAKQLLEFDKAKSGNKDKDKDKDKEGGKPKKRFTPPTLNEVQNYCQERKNNVNPQSFVDFYESKGWFVGKNKMKDWKAAVRNWEKNSYSNNNGNSESEREKLKKKFNNPQGYSPV